MVDDGRYTKRPGDDIQLRFGVSGFPEYDMEVSAGDFMAVYDHKFIWRAQLYIDETLNEDGSNSGNNDWNDLNPWNNADNNWNLNGNGGQCDLPEWTRWNDGVNIANTTAYGWGCADSVADFEADLEEQKNALTAYYADTNNEQLGENPHPSEHREWSPWVDTFAPGAEAIDRWHNYLFGRFDSDDQTYHYLTINGERHNPYMPGLSTWKRFDPDQDNYRNYDTKKSAGVECVGFVQRCASYEDNPYEAIDINSRCIWGGGMPTLMYGENSFSSDEYSWAINDRNLLIPGDVLIGNGHIVMVLKIVYLANSRIIALNDNGTSDGVFVIEATKGDDEQWMVLNSQTWQDLGAGYIRRRLRIKD